MAPVHLPEEFFRDVFQATPTRPDRSYLISIFRSMTLSFFDSQFVCYGRRPAFPSKILFAPSFNCDVNVLFEVLQTFHCFL